MKQHEQRIYLLLQVMMLYTIFLHSLIGERYDSWHNSMIEMIHGTGPCFLESLDLIFHVPIEEFVRVTSDALLS